MYHYAISCTMTFGECFEALLLSYGKFEFGTLSLPQAKSKSDLTFGAMLIGHFS